MKLEGRAESANVEDRRGQRMRGGPAGIGCGGILLVLALSYFTGQDPGALLQLLGSIQEQAPVSEAPLKPVRLRISLGTLPPLC